MNHIVKNEVSSDVEDNDFHGNSTVKNEITLGGADNGFLGFSTEEVCFYDYSSVSYTHLDVYKRQV